MRVIVVGRDREVIDPLIDRLTRENFEVILLDNSAGVLSFIKKNSLQFLVAEASMLVDHGLGREVLKRCPLARLVALTSEPSRLGMIDALAGGLVDYFPRRPEYFEDVVGFMTVERERLIRWRHILLSGAALADFSSAPSGAAADSDGEPPTPR